MLSGDPAAARQPNPTEPEPEPEAKAEPGGRAAKRKADAKADAKAAGGASESGASGGAPGPGPLVWAKLGTAPWWPGYLGEPTRAHLKELPGAAAGGEGAGKGGAEKGAEGLKFVVFFGPRPSWAWLPADKVEG